MFNIKNRIFNIQKFQNDSTICNLKEKLKTKNTFKSAQLRSLIFEALTYICIQISHTHKDLLSICFQHNKNYIYTHI